MARYTGPRFKVARHLGVNVFGHPKALKRGAKSHKKLSEYGEQLIEKQRLKFYYGVSEKQLKKYVDNALKGKENSSEKLVQNLERRLDNIVYRLGFTATLRQARQVVSHGHVSVNGEKVNIPSYSVKIGETVSLRDNTDFIRQCIENFRSVPAQYGYLEKDMENAAGKLARLPSRDEVPIEVRDSKVLEFYSR